ncbi:asparagine synthase (glutamine-hydrolyzing) [Pseudomonadota bacterium]|nr:asparagine synthase (glutamine-hydrolyzing) [Pseudomonadota bacterium]
MCGFTGFIHFDQTRNHNLEEIIVPMTHAINHRGPDDYGIWVDEEINVALGHRRLAVLDLSESGKQPMHSQNNNYVIVFNGEIYNHNDIRKSLMSEKDLKHHWIGTSDTETLLAAIDFWGLEKTLSSLIGMFSFALWDKKNKKLSLVRDRVGEKPLYYGWTKNGFIFGSELKALKKFPSFENSIDRNALKQYFRYNYIPAPFSIYENIFKLEPGAFIVSSVDGLRAKSVESKAYWSLSRKIKNSAFQLDVDEKTQLNLVENQLKQSINQQMIADVPLGAFLSGGIDSSLIVSLMQEQSTSKVKTFTIGFDNSMYDESPFAKEVAKHLGTDHHELFVTAEQTREVIPLLPEIYDEPFSDSSQIPTYLVCKAARQKVTVALSGDAGDEIFGGYNRYFWGPNIWNKISWLPFSVRKVLGNSINKISIDNWNKLGFILNFFNKGSHGISSFGDKIHKMSERLKYVNSIDELYESLVTEWRPNHNLVKETLNSNEEESFKSKFLDLAFEGSASRMMYMDTLTYLPDDILCKVDRAAMANSLETRAPFLDHRLIELAWTLPEKSKISGNIGKLPLRKILEKYVPNNLIDRPKAGFGIPVGEWLRGPLRSWADSLLDSNRIEREGFLNAEPINKIWSEHLSGDRDWTPRLWSILMFQAWLESQMAD